MWVQSGPNWVQSGPDWAPGWPLLARSANAGSSGPEISNLAGGKLGLADALIAGIAADLGATVVSRNRPDFARQGIPVLTY